MGELPAVPNVLKVNAHWGIEGDLLGQTIHYFRYTGGPPSPANCATMADAFVTDFAIEFAALCSNFVGMLEAVVTDLSSDTASQGAGGTPWVGTRGTELTPPGAAVVVAHTIGRRYRGGKPRTYLPAGVSSDIATTGLWTTGFVAAVDAAWGAAIAGFLTAGAGCTLDNIVNVSYYKGFTVVTSPTTGRSRNVPTKRASPVVDNILGHITNRQIGSQRRRNKDA
jgi:hypothetical protein